ncbi:MAG: non-hydrolyzing UDP-N-acetylglucosamine 2-epimerase [Actinomycetota bacterium]
MKVANIVGARPQFIKAAAVCAAARADGRVSDVLIHTGQHYDSELSDIFFTQLAIPRPDVELGIGSAPHGQQTGQMMMALEGTLSDLAPDIVLVYGDTNTTLAGAMTAVNLGIPLAHVEAGLRSFNREMPEEINRIITDRLSSVLFCPTQSSVDNLVREGVGSGLNLVGDVMVDVLRNTVTWARMSILGELGIRTGSYYLMTLHRAGNTDDVARLETILKAVSKLPHPVIFPVHPRTRNAIATMGISVDGSIRQIAPVGYLEILALQMHARAILTDSGGMQKEAYCLGVPCITLRDETEWTETVDAGWNVLAGADPDMIAASAERFPPEDRPALYGNGDAAQRIVDRLVMGEPWDKVPVWLTPRKTASAKPKPKAPAPRKPAKKPPIKKLKKKVASSRAKPRKKSKPRSR